MRQATVEGFLLLTLENTTLTSWNTSKTGSLALECVSIPIPDSKGEKDVYLVIKLGSFETPIDPATVINVSIAPQSGTRSYKFHAPSPEGSDFILRVSPPTTGEDAQVVFMQDIDTFDSILCEYAHVQADGTLVPDTKQVNADYKSIPVNAGEIGSQSDLRGHLVVVDQDNGEIVGEFEDRFRVTEDTKLSQKGHEDDPVIIEVPEEKEGAMDVFVRSVPPEERDWITTSATVVSHVISTTTNLLLTSISFASKYYISHSQPSPHHPDVKARSATVSPSSTQPPPPPLPPRALVLLTSENTRKGLAGVHAVSGHAVTVTSKTVSLVEGMIRRAVGGKAKRAATTGNMLSPIASTSKPASRPSSRAASPVPSFGSDRPPPYRATSAIAAEGKFGFGNSNSGPTSSSPTSIVPPPLPNRKPLSTPRRVLLSADLILSTIDDSAKKVFEVGSARLGEVVGHKYGAEAAQNSLLLTGTGRNLILVYVDMRGMGRRALLKTAGKEYAKGKFSSGDTTNPSVAAPPLPKR